MKDAADEAARKLVYNWRKRVCLSSVIQFEAKSLCLFGDSSLRSEYGIIE